MMTIHPNGTDAKDIALYFLKVTGQPVTSPIVSRTIGQVKRLLDQRYTKQQMLDVIDYIIIKQKKNVYSFGYINSCIKDVLDELNEQAKQERYKEVAQRMEQTLEEEMKKLRAEVKTIDDSTERNKQKAQRFSSKSREREKYSFDLFEK